MRISSAGLVIFVAAFAGYSHVAIAQSTLTPASFEAQINANAIPLRNWSTVYEKEGSFRKVAFRVLITDVDVTASKSLLKPYIGKAVLTYTVKHGEQMATRDDAEASPLPNVEEAKSFSECEVYFVPKQTRWEYQEATCRSTITPQWMALERMRLTGTPLGAMLEQLDIAVPVQPPAPPSRPAKRR